MSLKPYSNKTESGTKPNLQEDKAGQLDLVAEYLQQSLFKVNSNHRTCLILPHHVFLKEISHVFS